MFAFEVVLLELLLSKKVMEAQYNGKAVLLWKEIKGMLKDDDGKEERLRMWIDLKLKELVPH